MENCEIFLNGKRFISVYNLVLIMGGAHVGGQSFEIREWGNSPHEKGFVKNLSN